MVGLPLAWVSANIVNPRRKAGYCNLVWRFLFFLSVCPKALGLRSVPNQRPIILIQIDTVMVKECMVHYSEVCYASCKIFFHKEQV